MPKDQTLTSQKDNAVLAGKKHELGGGSQEGVG